MWWRRFKRKQRFRRKKQITYLLLLALMFSMSLGYAVLNTSLNIIGISSLANAKWDIHFDNIVVKEGSVTPTTEPTISNDTTVAFSVTLENPGDYYEFNIDVVNAGTINAMIDTISIQPVLTVAQQKYLDYIVTYSDRTELAENQRLNAGTSETLRIAFIYKEGDPEDYPDEDEDILIEVSITYVQEDEDAEDVNHPPKLYNVLKDAAEERTYAREYTGSHKDSFTQNPSNKIYHMYADSDTNGTAILDKNNVVFAGHCWQMVRTTDTGGVKMIYNGEAVDNQCLSTRGTHVGYVSGTSLLLNSNYWYGTDYTYDSTTKTFKISGTTEQATWNETTGPGLVGKYTCKSTSVDGTCATLYLVESYYDTTSAYVISLNSNSNYSQFGTLQFNASSNSPTYVGYMYGDVYAYSTTSGTTSQSFTATQTMLQFTYLRTSFWYAQAIDYGTLTANRYSLVSPYQVSSTSDYPNLVGKYTFGSSSQTNTATSVYYIAAVNNTTMYYKQLQNGNLLSAYEPIVFGDSIHDNGDGTYTINNPTNVTLSDWYTNYANYKEKYTCNDSSTTCAFPRYTTATSPTDYTYINASEKIMIGKTRSGLTLTDTLLVRKDELVIDSSNYSDYKYTCNTDSATCTETTLRMISGYSTTGYNYAPNHYYGSSVTWDGTNYTLVDPIEIENYNNMNNISTHHYMCVSEGLKTCVTVAYVYYYTGSGTMYYITLKDGVTTVDKALEDMLTKNTTNSTMKSGVDAWYKHYLLEDYDDYIEDTIFCNDRSIRALNGWDPDGGMTNAYLQFKEYIVISDLSCTNTTDQFSISNNNAKLTYKVGLMSVPDMNILNNINARKTGQWYWLASPSYFLANDALGRLVNSSASMSNGVVYAKDGVRPAISLKPGITYSSGDGSMANPYVVDTD